MKEATGELNMTVITVVAIAAVGLLFTMFVWPNIQANLILSSACSNVNSSGNYTSDQIIGGANDAEADVQCIDFTCTVEYQGKTYQRNCTEE
ncbi:MAG: hypothetical protein IJO33_03405 [Bacilli bacterium]|nr:hypothetical protein [Bacilli bacterium]